MSFSSNNQPTTHSIYLQGGGEMGRLTREYNWVGNDLGVPEYWPQSLLNTVGIILNSKFPMWKSL